MITILLILLACTDNRTPEEKEEKRKWSKCVSKAHGSQPECWDDKDWEIFCSRVECKQ